VSGSLHGFCFLEMKRSERGKWLGDNHFQKGVKRRRLVLVREVVRGARRGSVCQCRAAAALPSRAS
jgi:hypothetical protein